MKKSNYTIRGIMVLFSCIWSTVILLLIQKMDCFRGYSRAARWRSVMLMAVVYGITLIYNSIAIGKCYKLKCKGQGGSKAPLIMCVIGFVLFFIVAGFVSFAYVLIAATGGV